jgi:hypothetical protein
LNKNLLLALALVAATPASAAITWSWSFAGEAGTFVTDGELVAGVAAPGTYNLTDFSATASTVGATLGSLSGGQYNASGFSTNLPYAFSWNGSAVTFWDSAGGNSFDWWVFDDLAVAPGWYFFGWDTGNINDPTRAAFYTGDINNPLTVGTVTVSVAGSGAIPEPATWAMLITGFGLIGTALRRRTAVAA